MKNILKIIVLVPLVLWGCAKEQGSRSVKAQMAITEDGIIIPSEEYILELYEAELITMGLMATANFGNHPTKDDDVRISMHAGRVANIDLVLTDQVFHFYRDQIAYYTGTHLLNLFGKVHDMSITTEDEGTVEYQFYIPELITADVNYGAIGLRRTESVLRWNPDSQYPTKVVFAYILYGGGQMLYRDAVIVDDNGVLDLCQFLKNQDAKSIEISVYRVNAMEVNTEGKRIALAFTTADHHFYAIED